MIGLKNSRFTGVSALAVITAAVSAPAQAQVSEISVLSKEEYNDVYCYYSENYATEEVCEAEGQRSVTYRSTTRSNFDETRDRVDYRYDVDFEGKLNNYGEFITIPASGENSGSDGFWDENSSISVISSYTGVITELIDSSASTPSFPHANDAVVYSSYEDMSTIVTEMDIQGEYEFAMDIAGFGAAEFEGQIESIDPSAITSGNQTLIKGRFGGEANNDTAIVFGTLSGTATLMDGGHFTEQYQYDGESYGYYSAYQLEVDITPTITTQLDAAGLLAPHVEVNDGIEMNGSRITGLADGVAMDDAATVAQVMAAMTGSPQISINGYAAASATGARAMALGDGATADGDYSAAQGYNTRSSGNRSTAVGMQAQATANEAGAFGALAKASGTGANAFGTRAVASAAYSTAVGNSAKASGGRSTVVGVAAQASGEAATATGAYASAAYAQSTAIGYQATATAAKQVAVGGAGSSVKIGDIDASTAAQEGQLYSVTVDEEGTLGRGGALATGQQVASLASQMQSVAAVSDAQFTALTGRVDGLEFELNELDQRASGGIAAAMALGGTAIVPDKSISMTVSAATWGGEQGFAGSFSGRVNDGVYVSAGVTGDTGSKKMGGRVAATFGF